MQIFAFMFSSMWKIHILFFSAIANASFLAVGPPAAPPLPNLGSANSFNEDDLSSSFPNVRFTNLTKLELTRNQEQLAPNGAGYFWLSDERFSHKARIS
jgi:hypothetical protein